MAITLLTYSAGSAIRSGSWPRGQSLASAHLVLCEVKEDIHALYAENWEKIVQDRSQHLFYQTSTCDFCSSVKGGNTFALLHDIVNSVLFSDLTLSKISKYVKKS